MSLRGASRGLTCTAYDYIGETDLYYSSTLGCNVAISRKRHCRKVAFQQIPTAPNLYVYLAVVSIEAIGNSVPRDTRKGLFVAFAARTAARLRT